MPLPDSHLFALTLGEFIQDVHPEIVKRNLLGEYLMIHLIYVQKKMYVRRYIC